MASSLSEDEFHRMQLQLLELRTTNYELDGKCRKLERELQDYSCQIESLEKELVKVNKAINKSKKAKEVEMLIQENEFFQHKLASQEEEFRLQNQTVMTELSSLVSDNELLTKECKELKENGGKIIAAESDKSSDWEDQIRYLQAQNVALQKNLAAVQEKHEKEISILKQKSGIQVAGPQGSAGNEDVASYKGEVESQVEEDVPTVSDTAGIKSEKKIEELMEKVNELQLGLDTEKEEKQLLKEQLRTSKDQVGTLEDEIHKLHDKFKKKQESLLHLQKEKESVYEEGRKKAEELQGARERDQKYYQDQIVKLQQELEKGKQVQDNLKASSEGHSQELQRKLAELQKQVDAASIVGNHQLQEQGYRYKQEVKDLSARLAALSQINGDLKAQLQESQRANEEATSQLIAAQQERDTQVQALQEVSKTAEKRKALLDEMAIKYQQEYHDHRQQTQSLEERHRADVGHLHGQIAKLEGEIQELSKAQPVLEELHNKVTSLEEAKGWLDRRVKETEDQLRQSQKESTETKEDLERKHEAELRAVNDEHSAELLRLQQLQQQETKEWEEKEHTSQGEIRDLKSAVSGLNQSIKDKVEDQKIGAKKDNLLIKDLKRQLRAERNKVERLQEALKEVSPENKNRGMEELFQPAEPGDLSQCDGSSVSSWSAGASGLGKDSTASGPQSPTALNASNYSFTADPGDEHSELLQRLAKLQQEKWQLEERVSHLETSSSCMAEELLNKTEIIKHHFISTQNVGGRRHAHNNEDKLTLKKVMEMVKMGEHSDWQDMNRKLQLVLEETLTKNMHLQQDLEAMSQEVVRLSKLSIHAHTPASRGLTLGTPPATWPTENGAESQTVNALSSPPPLSSPLEEKAVSTLNTETSGGEDT